MKEECLFHFRKKAASILICLYCLFPVLSRADEPLLKGVQANHMQEEGKQLTQEEAKAKAEGAVVNYLTERKKWARREYRLEHKGLSTDKKCLVVWAIYLEDETRPVPGGGRSVAVYVDKTDFHIVNEFRFQ